jgi:hypothetical protein
LDYLTNKVIESADNLKKLWRTTDELLHRSTRLQRSDKECARFATGFSEFFVDKLRRIREAVVAEQTSLSLCTDARPERAQSGPSLTCFTSTTPDEVISVARRIRSKSLPLDILPTSLLKSSITAFAPAIAKLVNLSLTAEKMPPCLKVAQVLPLFKKNGVSTRQTWRIIDRSLT